MTEHVKRTFVVENTWKCSACGNANPGRDLKCQKCAQTKQKVDTDQVDAEAAPEVSDSRLLAMANAGENWACPFCGSQERNDDGKCRNCGSRTEEGREKLPDAVPSAAPPPGHAKPHPPTTAPIEPSHTGRNALIVGLVLVVVLIGVCFVPRSKVTKVKSVAWTYQVDLEQKRVEHEQGFTHPSGAFNLSCQQRQNGTHDCDEYKCNPHDVKVDCNPHDCKCHKVTKDKKNGFSQVEEVCDTCYDKCDKQVEDTCHRQCPTMAEWCSYDVINWQVIKTEKKEGTDHTPKWPDLTVREPASERLERKELYEVTFSDGEKSWTSKPSSLEDFNRFQVGAEWKIHVTSVGIVTPVQAM